MVQGRDAKRVIGEFYINNKTSFFDACYDEIQLNKDHEVFIVKINEAHLTQMGFDAELFYIGMKTIGTDLGFEYDRLQSEQNHMSMLIFYKPDAKKEQIIQMAATIEVEKMDCTVMVV